MDGAAVMDAPVETSAETQEEASSQSAGGANETTAGERQARDENPRDEKSAPDKAAARKNADAVRKHLADMKSRPETEELGRELTNKMGKVRGYEAVYPTVREAREARALFDQVGGRDGLAGLQESHASLQRLDALLESGDPAILDEVFAQSPEGMAKLVPAILERAAKANPQGYAAAVQPVVSQALQQDGFPDALNGLIDVYNRVIANQVDGNTIQHLGRVLNAMKGWYEGMQGGRAPRGVDPGRMRFDRERQAYEMKRQDDAIRETFHTSLGYAAEKIDTALAPEVRRYGLTTKQSEDLRQAVWHEIEKRRNTDRLFQTGIRTKFGGLNGRAPAKDAVTYLNSFTDRELAGAVKDVVETRYGHIKSGTAKKNPTAQPGGSSHSTTQVRQPPRREDIDYSDKRTDVFAGRAVLKGSKQVVSWR